MSIEAGVDCSCLGTDDDHLHMLCSFKSVNDSGMVLKNMESFTAMKLLDAIIKNTKESRKENMLNIFEASEKKSSSNFRFKFWEHENHPILLDSELLFTQKLNYLHWNPVTAGFVNEPWHWRYSSATDYLTKEKGMLNLIILE